MTTVKIGSITEKISSCNPSAVFAGSSFIYVDINSVDRESKTILAPQTVLAEEAPSRARQVIKAGDVIVSTVRPNLNAVAWVPEELDGAICSTGFCVLRPNTKTLHDRYLFHWVKTPKFVLEMSRLATGASYPAVSDKIIKESLIPLPPLPEQKRIAAILDKADAIRRKREKAIELTDSFLRSVFLEMFGNPESNPHGFKKGTIRELVSEVKYGTSDKAGATGNYEILRMNNLSYAGDIDLSDLKRIDLEQKEETKYLVRKGDLLFNRTNSKELVGKSAVYTFETPRAIAGYLIRIRPNERANIEYIAAYLNSQHGKKTLFHMCKSIIGMANINAQELQDIEILIPPVELQNNFAVVVEKVRELKSKLRRSLKESETLSASLSQGLFAGGSLKVQRLAPLKEVACAL
jgi:type I restriction enzyme, S subunit